jgi:hypothetical protein
MTKILWFQSKENFEDTTTSTIYYFWAEKGIFSEVVLGFQNFGYDF